MKKGIGAFFGILLVIAIFVGLSCVVVTGEDEYKLVRQFGKIDHVESEAGLSFKVPFIQTVDTLPKKILIYDLAPSDVITRDKKTMITNSYVLWQISDPVKFAQTLNSSIGNAESRINTVVYNAMKSVMGNMTQTEIISARDGELSEQIMSLLDTSIENYGIEIVSVETKRLDLPSDNKAAVYERMISERGQIAATYTAEGDSESQIIKNTTDKEVSIMISQAKAKAESIVAEGEAEYMNILSAAYADASKSDFYSFVRSLDAAKASLSGENKTLILDEDSPIAQIFTGNE
jgi:membrane protease subunit HflC